MANIDKLIPFILQFETGVNRKENESMEKLFNRARVSGFSNHPLDKGGATMCGVTLATYSCFRERQGYASTSAEELRRMPYAEWRPILKSMYWDRWQADKIRSQQVANILVDWVWASGVYGIKEPQKILGVTPDGIVGEKTLAALNGYPCQKDLFDKIHNARISFVENIARRKPSQRIWLKGWLRRIDAITWCMAFVALLFAGCTRTIYVPVENDVQHKDSVSSMLWRVDTVVDRDTVNTFVKGDTVMIDRIRWRIRTKEHRDTIYRQRIDSVFIKKPYPVDISGSCGTSFSKFLNTLKWILAILGISAIVAFLIRIYRKFL